MTNELKIKGARVHNLKDVSLVIPKDKLIVFSGVSGSGKSSLAFDTIYAEGQRRYVESLNTYARQFLGIMEKPDVDLIEGLSPAISIDQKTTSKNPRSTVGTTTEVYDYLRLLFARIGHPHCPICGREISSQSVEQIVDSVIELTKIDTSTTKFPKYLIMSPVVIDKKGEFATLFENLRSKGFTQVRIDGQVRDLSEDLVLLKTNKHTISVIIDRLTIEKKIFRDPVSVSSYKSRLTDSIEMALKLSDGLVYLGRVNDKEHEIPRYPKDIKDYLYSERFACPVDGIQLPEIEPRTFSFNSPHGACPKCTGLGKILKVDPDRLFADELSITEGGILPFANMFENDTWYSRIILAVCSANNINPRIPIKHLGQREIEILVNGTGKITYFIEGTNKQGKITSIVEKFSGLQNELERRQRESISDYVRVEIEKYMKEVECDECHGERLNKEALSITIDGRSIAKVCDDPIQDALEWINTLPQKISDRENQIADLILKEIKGRITFLVSVGLEYLSLSRTAKTLSGGEAQRIRLASQIGSGLTGVLYVLDEPTIGLHQKDNFRLINTLKKLRDIGNTVIVVEHDRDMISQADHIVEFGPRAGKHGGAITFEGSFDQILKAKKSITGDYLSGRKKITGKINKDILPFFKNLDPGNISITKCSSHNLKNIDVSIPLGKFVVITGVSGSGKSTFLTETLYPAIQREFNPFFRGDVGVHDKLTGIENIDKIIMIDQSPIGRTPRSNPATYTKVFDHIRDIYTSTKDARTAGYKKGRFSFNVKGGRCENCEGQGQIKIEMQFMSDIWVECEVCRGARYNTSTLEIDYRGKNIADVLDLTVDEAYDFFENHYQVVAKLETMKSVGLGYMELGQSATTLSGGEAQRIKLSAELSKRDTGRTLYILDEPTTGLHFDDLNRLVKVLKLLVYRGNTVVVIEHNMDVIAQADWIIDLGPEGGDKGGEIVAEGPIKSIIKNKKSFTGKYLLDHINSNL